MELDAVVKQQEGELLSTARGLSDANATAKAAQTELALAKSEVRMGRQQPIRTRAIPHLWP